MSYYICEGEFPTEIQNRLNAGMRCGSCIGKGWLQIIVELDKKLAVLTPDYKIDQIKEKFGELRFYISAADHDDCYDLIHDACNQAANICDVCGEPGKIHLGKWLVTRCDEHANL